MILFKFSKLSMVKMRNLEVQKGPEKPSKQFEIIIFVQNKVKIMNILGLKNQIIYFCYG